MTTFTPNFSTAFDPMLALRACRKRWRLAGAIFVTVSTLATIATLQIKPKFESEASLFVRLGRESAGLDPTATTSQITPIYETREQELNSALEVMNSRKLLEAVIGVIGEDVILDPTLFSFETWQQSLKNTEWPELDPEIIHRSNKQREIAVAKIHKAISLSVERSSSVIGVSSTAITPDLAQAITKTMLEAFRSEHVRLNHSNGLQFFDEQVTMLQGQLEEARQRITAKKNKLGIMSIDGERTRLEDVLTALEKQLNLVVPDLHGAKASTVVMEEEVAALPNRTQPHDASDTLRKKLNELEQERGLMLIKFTEQHFRVRNLDSQIAFVKQQIASPDNRNAANPTLREFEVKLATDRTRVAQTTAEIEQLQQQQISLRASLMTLNDAEGEMKELQDRESEIKDSLAKATDKREQARLLDELSRQRISNIQIVQPATFNPNSTSTSRTLALLAGLVVASIAAFIIPAVIEFAAWYLQSIRSVNTDGPSGPSTEELLPCGG